MFGDLLHEFLLEFPCLSQALLIDKYPDVLDYGGRDVKDVRFTAYGNRSIEDLVKSDARLLVQLREMAFQKDV